MKKILSVGMLLLATVMMFSSCQKWSAEHRDLYNFVAPPASPISDAAPLCGYIKGTMLAGKTYHIGCDVIIKPTDTLLIQPGVKIIMDGTYGIVVQGVLVSNGTQANPIYFTTANNTHTDAPNLASTADNAFSAQWRGILAATTCPLLVLRWTHIEFGGAPYGSTVGGLVGQSSSTQFEVLFQNVNGSFVMEDSWLYGAIDDAMRISNGKIHIFRNTFEKTGLTGGDCVNVKGGTVGTMAYNMFMGTATNGQKASNKGQAAGAPQTTVVMYNNTFVNGGYRQTQSGRGANINFEEGARGKFYNNVVINCKFGPRVVGNPIADTANLRYGNNFQYADNATIANQFYPVGYITNPQTTDIPSYSLYLPTSYTLGAAYDGTAVVQKIDPQFVNYPLPTQGGYTPDQVRGIGSYDFHLKSTSPLLGKGNTKVVPLTVVPLDPTNGFGAMEVTLPGVDLGCYQLNGTGNKH